MNNFSKGTFVEWASQSQGVQTTKRGTVLEFIPAGEPIKTDLSSGGIKPTHIRFDTKVSSIDRYLVSVLKEGKKQAFWYYAPRASGVKAVSHTP